MRARDILGPDGPFAAAPGYELRESQLRMADAVERALADDRVLVVEAGTGTGKTLAYLVPALAAGRRVIVSTGTRALQDQIMRNDVPLLEARLGRPLRVACMKGLSNYVCLRRFEEFRRSELAVAPAFARDLDRLVVFRERSLTGDRADLAEVPEDAPIWGHVTSSSETRIGTPCRHHDACFVTRMRREAAEAELVVVNHHLFFADLATRGPHGGAVLPDYDAVIFDEAHQIEDAATSFFGVTLSTARVVRLVRDAERALRDGERDAHALEVAARLCRSVTGAADAYFATLPAPRDGGRVELPRGGAGRASEQAFFALDDALSALCAHIELRATRSEVLGALVRRTTDVREDLAAVAEGSRGSRVAWVQRVGQGGTSVGASPIDVSDVLREKLFEAVPSVVLTSATLTTAGRFDFIRKRLGVGRAEELALPSPFDYSKAAALYLPMHLPDPRDPAFDEEAPLEVERLVRLTGGGAFVLCTSFRRMRLFAEHARKHLDLPVFVQHEAPKPALLERFRAAGNGVLVATTSFWEGVDVPGDALRLVVLEKVPFEVPTDPLVAARCARLEERGESPFSSYLLPSAAIALKQGFGRLIRTATDRGVVAVLDPRIHTKSYGRTLLESLPDASRCHSFEELVAYRSSSGEANGA